MHRHILLFHDTLLVLLALQAIVWSQPTVDTCSNGLMTGCMHAVCTSQCDLLHVAQALLLLTRLCTFVLTASESHRACWMAVDSAMLCRGGLEGRLLGLALQAEQPQLEAQRTALLQQEEEQRLQLAALDTQLLQSLATSKVFDC